MGVGAFVWVGAAEFGDEGWERRAPVARETMMITTSLRLPTPIMDEVRKAAEERGVKPTALMRRWIEAALVDAETAVSVAGRSASGRSVPRCEVG